MNRCIANLMTNDAEVRTNCNTLSKDQYTMVSHCDSAFAVWNTLTSPELTTNNMEKESNGEESD